MLYVLSRYLMLIPGMLVRVLLCFSICKHVPRMTSFDHAPGSMKCVNGMRSLAFLWIVLGHSFQLGVWITSAPTTGEHSST